MPPTCTLVFQGWVRVAVADKDKGAGFVVAQQDVVGRPLLLDQSLFKEQRLDFTTRYCDLNLRDACDHGLGLGVECAAKVAAKACFQAFGLAYVKGLTMGVQHPVDSGGLGKVGEKLPCIKRSHGVQKVPRCPAEYQKQGVRRWFRTLPPGHVSAPDASARHPSGSRVFRRSYNGRC